MSQEQDTKTAWKVCRPSRPTDLRDYFAAMVLPMAAHDLTVTEPREVARRAYEIADAMLEERER